MRHTIHIMFGDNSKYLICGVMNYIKKFGNEDDNQSCSAFLYTEEDSGNALLSEVKHQPSTADTFIPGIDDLYNSQVESCYNIIESNRQEYFNSCLTDMFNKRVNINTPGDSDVLYITLYIPLYEKHFWEVAKEILSFVSSTSLKINVDLFLLSNDLEFLFNSNLEELIEKTTVHRDESECVIKEILNYKKHNQSISHLILLQNSNVKGISLNLNKDSLIRIIGEYSLLLVNHYHEIFNPSAEDPDNPIASLGISVLNFDKYNFVQYLLHKAYIYILDREGIMQEEVDVNKVSSTVQKKLKDNINLYTSFYAKYIKPLLDQGVTDDEIISQIRPHLDNEIKRLSDEFQSFVNDPTLSLPEKEATLAQLLGEDNALLVGYMFNKKQLVIDDCSREVLDLFVNLNNKILAYNQKIKQNQTKDENASLEEDDDTEPDELPAIDYPILSQTTHKPVINASEIIDELKSIKVSMRESSNYIRLKSEELKNISDQIEDNINSKKRLTKDGFVFDGRKYQLQSNIEESILEEDYSPRISELPTDVDLRKYFTRVKDQGQIGSCTAFSIVSIYEYILKYHNAESTNLSEKFVYYNSRKKQGKENEDCGSSLYDAISSIRDAGVCLESFCPYDETVTDKPSDMAYEDAATRKILKALNVKPRLDDIKSALSVGYPVAISLKIFNSFVPEYGFVHQPTKDEINGESGNHAMVICGYSDATKIFIVRNSWGDSFGQNGYCFIPYSYIGNPNLLNSACIITEVNDFSSTIEIKDIKTAVNFDMSNSKIKSVILKNLIEEEKLKLSKQSASYTEKSIDYNTLFQFLGNNSVREDIYEKTKTMLIKQNEELEEQRSETELERRKELSSFDENTNKFLLILALSAVFFVLFYSCLCYFIGVKDALFNGYSYSVYFIMFIAGVLSYFYYKQRVHQRICLQEDYNEKLKNITDQQTKQNREISIIQLKTHTAGMIIDSLSSLLKEIHSKYNGMCSYVGNLKVWRKEEENFKEQINPFNETPFISLLSEECLDNYFTRNKHICDKMNLYSMFDQKYKISDREIIKFKNTLKQTLMRTLFDGVGDFSIYEYLKGSTSYPYVDSAEDVGKILQRMDHMSSVFANIRADVDINGIVGNDAKILFLETFENTDRTEVYKVITENLRDNPIVLTDKSKLKLTLVQVARFNENQLVLN